MKKRFYLLACAALLFNGLDAHAQNGGKKVLVVYYSYSGNTRTVAEQIKKGTGGDIFEIQPVEAYPAEYKAVVDRAKREVDSGYRPALKTKVENIGEYDVVFVGSPCWWYTIAPPVASFLSAYDFSGKTIVPFMTHEGSRMGQSVEDIKMLCPGATVLDGLPVRGGDVNDAEGEVVKWLQKIGMTK
ncbi:MAG: flavodoxin [Bacteroidales bacterium]|nr:flavodoxin [Bacteroidales bacterium]